MKTLLAAVTGILFAASASAQLRLDAPPPILAERVESNVQETRSAWRPLRIAKWGTLAGAAGAALYGFLESGRADDAYDALENACEQDRTNCLRREPDGAYSDPALEAMYQDVRRLDRHTRTGLIASQVGLAASLVLFLLDLGNDGPPDDVPYRPPRFQFSPSREGAELGLRVPIG